MPEMVVLPIAEPQAALYREGDREFQPESPEA